MQTRQTPNIRNIPPAIVLPGNLQEAIRARAGEIYVKSGMLAGHDIENWIQAEAEVRREFEERSLPRAAVVIRVNGVQYTGEYSLTAADGYAPGEFSAGAPVPVRFEGDKMYLKRRNGIELETRIVQKQA